MFKAAIVGALAFGLTSPTLPDVVLSGTTKDCAGPNYFQVPGVTVAAFNPATNPRLVDLLRSMDTAVFVDADLAAVARFTAKYSELVDIISSSIALGRATTSEKGTFSLRMPAVDSVLVIGYALSEDEPNYYSYRIVTGRVDASVILDMSGGFCSKASVP